MMAPLDVRRDLLPPLLALAFSLGVHGALLGAHPLWWQPTPPRTADIVVVQLQEETSAPSVGTDAPGVVAPPAPAPEPQPAATRAAPPAAPRPRPEPPETAPAPPLPAPATPPALPPEEAEPAPRETPVPRPAQAPPSTPSAAAETAPLALRELLPSAAELRRFSGRPETPDPTAAGVREATLSLGNEDLRYRRYLETVHAAIDRSEKWKEAVLMGGGGGVVVVRLTLTRLGQLVAASVTRSSGNPLLDSAAVDAVQRARIPPFPDHWQLETLHLYAQFNYQLVAE